MLFYPYNEILPRKKAHDAFIFRECVALSHKMAASLLIGKGSSSNEDLFSHYGMSGPLQIIRLPICRKNNPLNISWNRIFFHFVQNEIVKQKPGIVLMSVLKEAAYHLQRKVEGIYYLYEVHELAYYPGRTFSKRAQIEKEILSRCDLVIVTTNALKEILQNPPYSLRVPVEVIPLAALAKQIETSPSNNIRLGYVGQLYAGQGIPLLLKAIKGFPQISLKIIGGTLEEINHLRKMASDQVEFVGFVPPSHLEGHLQDCDVLVAPFEATGRMPYVAHTKLIEYAEWKKPIIAPDLPVVREHLNEDEGVIFFENLEKALATLNIEELKKKAKDRPSRFSWETRASRYKELFSTFAKV